MKFFYRGVTYENQPSTLEVTEGEIGGTYRGKNWKVHYPQRHSLRKTASHEFIYRGVTYKK